MKLWGKETAGEPGDKSFFFKKYEIPLFGVQMISNVQSNPLIAYAATSVSDGVFSFYKNDPLLWLKACLSGLEAEKNVKLG